MIQFKLPLIIPALHPLFFYTVLIMCGIWWQSLGYPWWYSFALWATWSLGQIIASEYFNIPKITITSLGLACAFLLGATTYQKQHNAYQTKLAQLDSKPTDLHVIVTDVAPFEHKHFKTVITASIQKGESHILSGQSVLLYTGTATPVQVSDHLLLSKILLKPPKDSMQPFLQREKILTTIVYDMNKAHCLYRPTRSCTRWIDQQKKRIYFGICQQLSIPTAACVASLFFGNKKMYRPQIDRLKQTFKLWGISHYLARSGLHLVIFILLWETILQFIPLHFFIKQLLMLLLTVLYLVFSWPSLSFIRSIATFFVYKFSIIGNEQSSPLHIITLISSTILLFNPYYLFFLDFQLSFGIVFVLAWIHEVTLQKNVTKLLKS